MNVQQGLTHFGANLTHFEVRSHSSEAADLDRSVNVHGNCVVQQHASAAAKGYV